MLICSCLNLELLHNNQQTSQVMIEHEIQREDTGKTKWLKSEHLNIIN